MRKVLLALLVASSGLLLQSQTFHSDRMTLATPDSTDRNPNGSSALAKLMRDMETYTRNARKAVLANQGTLPYPATFDQLYTAAITPDMEKSEHYDAFASVYITGVKAYVGSASTDRISAYNSMVSGCIACHSQHCPGPVPMIKKLMIDTGGK